MLKVCPKSGTGVLKVWHAEDQVCQENGGRMVDLGRLVGRRQAAGRRRAVAGGWAVGGRARTYLQNWILSLLIVVKPFYSSQTDTRRLYESFPPRFTPGSLVCVRKQRIPFSLNSRPFWYRTPSSLYQVQGAKNLMLASTKYYETKYAKIRYTPVPTAPGTPTRPRPVVQAKGP